MLLVQLLLIFFVLAPEDLRLTRADTETSFLQATESITDVYPISSESMLSADNFDNSTPFPSSTIDLDISSALRITTPDMDISTSLSIPTSTDDADVSQLFHLSTGDSKPAVSPVPSLTTSYQNPTSSSAFLVSTTNHVEDINFLTDSTKKSTSELLRSSSTSISPAKEFPITVSDAPLSMRLSEDGSTDSKKYALSDRSTEDEDVHSSSFVWQSTRDNLPLQSRESPQLLVENKFSDDKETHGSGTIWVAGEWGACSVSCGDGGVSSRQTYCAALIKISGKRTKEEEDGDVEGEEGSDEGNEVLERTDNDECERSAVTKPVTERTCNEDIECPRWYAGQWSACSVTCQTGYQLRAVVCRRSSVLHECSLTDKPTDKRICRTGIPCPDNVFSSRDLTSENPDALHASHDDLDIDTILVDWVAADSGQIGPAFPDKGDEVNELDLGRGWQIAAASKGSSNQNNEDARNIDNGVITNILKKVTPWYGVVKALTKNIITGGPKDALIRYMPNGYGPCSKTCAGGMKEERFACMRLNDSVEMDGMHCSGFPPRPAKQQQCNEHPCPFRWITSPYGSCSVSCGGGYQVRQVECIQYITDKDYVTSSKDCTDPAPPSESACNLAPCQAAWAIENWSEVFTRTLRWACITSE